MRAGTADRRDNEITLLETLHLRADFHHFAQRYMPDHKVNKAFRRRAVNEMADFLIRPANPDLERTDLDLSVLRELWGSMGNNLHLFFGGQYTYSAHSFLLFIGNPEPFV
jgi:hypothetical protein